MTDSDFCRSLLHAIAAAPVPVGWAAAAIRPAGMLLLWDDRPEASTLILEAVAGRYGLHLATEIIERGPNRRPMIGVLLQPHDEDPDAAVKQLRTAYAIATTEGGGDPSDGPF